MSRLFENFSAIEPVRAAFITEENIAEVAREMAVIRGRETRIVYRPDVIKTNKVLSHIVFDDERVATTGSWIVIDAIYRVGIYQGKNGLPSNYKEIRK